MSGAPGERRPRRGRSRMGSVKGRPAGRGEGEPGPGDLTFRVGVEGGGPAPGGAGAGQQRGTGQRGEGEGRGEGEVEHGIGTSDLVCTHTPGGEKKLPAEQGQRLG